MLTILEKPFVYARKLGKKSSAATTSSSMTIGGNLGSFLSGGDDSDGQNGPAGVEDVEAALGHPGKDGGGRIRSPVPPQTSIAAPVPPCYHRRGSLQLWQFLLALLNDPVNQTAIVWTGRGMEFKLIEPEEVKIELRSAVDFSRVELRINFCKISSSYQNGEKLCE